ncbi:MAG: molybdopterin-dependent oxidoreductase [Dictyoglomaceae bacterium]
MEFRGVCFFDCWDACGVIFRKDENLKIFPDSSNPYTRNFLCQKIYKFLKDRESNERILYPMIRRNGNFKKISWDTALDVILEKLKDLRDKNKEDLVVLGINSGTTGIMRFSALRFFSLYGKITLMDGSLCDDAGEMAQELDFGICINYPPENILESRTVLIWGRNPARTNIHFIPFIEEARKRGAFVYLIDPIKTETEKFVDKFIQVKPGRDIYLALAIAKVILKEGLEDRKFIENFTFGFEKFKNILEKFSIEELSENCDVNIKDIYEISERISKEKPASIWLGMGAQHYSHSVSTFRVIDALSAITGNLGVKGGGVSFSHYSTYSFDLSWTKLKNDFNLIPKAKLVSEFKNKLPEVLWIQSFNLFNQTQNIKELKEIAKNIPLKVVLDFRWNETTRLADIILPVATYLEKEDLRGSYWNSIIGYMPKIFENRGESLSEWEIYKELSRRMRFENEFGNFQEIMNFSLRKLTPFGINLTLLKEKGWLKSPLFPEIPFENGVFFTEDKKFHFIDNLPSLNIKISQEYPFVLITPKSLTRINSQRPMDHKKELPVCFIHPIWKSYYSFKEGYVVSPRGKLKVKFVFDPKVRPDTLCIDQGEEGINELCDERLAEDGKGASFFETYVRIEG